MAGLAVVRDLRLGVTRQQLRGSGTRGFGQSLARRLARQRFERAGELACGGLGDVAVAVLVELYAGEVPSPGRVDGRRGGGRGVPARIDVGELQAHLRCLDL